MYIYQYITADGLLSSFNIYLCLVYDLYVIVSKFKVIGKNVTCLDSEIRLRSKV